MAEIKFEEALRKLEKIVQNLEDGDLPLDEALEKYEEGVHLAKSCAKKLEVAKKKVEILLKNEDGSVELKDFDEGTTAVEEKSQGSRKRKAKTESGEGLL